jgi:hypothetical protein
MAVDLSSPKSTSDSSCLRHIRVLPFYVAVLSWIIMPLCLLFVLYGDAAFGGTTLVPPAKAGHGAGRAGSHRVHERNAYERPAAVSAAMPEAAQPAGTAADGAHAEPHLPLLRWMAEGNDASSVACLNHGAECATAVWTARLD